MKGESCEEGEAEDVEDGVETTVEQSDSGVEAAKVKAVEVDDSEGDVDDDRGEESGRAVVEGTVVEVSCLM